MQPFSNQTFRSNFFIQLQAGLPYTDIYWGFFYYLYMTGLRPNEIRNAINWDFSDPAGIAVPLSKGQAVRILDVEEFPVAITLEAFANYEMFKYVNPTTANRLFNVYFSPRYLLASGKYLGTYLLRHSFIKNLYDQTGSISYVASIMGEINENNISGYVNSAIFYH